MLTKLLSCKQKKAAPSEFSHTFSNGIKLHFQRSLFTVDDIQLPCYIIAVPVFLTSKKKNLKYLDNIVEEFVGNHLARIDKASMITSEKMSRQKIKTAMSLSH